MKLIKKREIFIEREQLVFFRDKSQEGSLMCNVCDMETIMLPPALFAEILRVSSREIYLLIEAKEVHIIEDESFQLFVCSISLANALKKREKLLH